MKLVPYLEEVFGEKIIITEYGDLTHIPLIYRNEYRFYECEMHGLHCILVELLSGRILAEKILVHFRKLEKILTGKMVLLFEELRPYQRRNLVRHRIPFIVPGKQIYLPFVFVDFKEVKANPYPVPELFSTVTQMVFLSVLGQEEDTVISNQLIKRLGLSSASINRAIRSLVGLGLLEEGGKATRKTYRRINKKAFWEKGNSNMVTPVQDVLLLSELPEDLPWYYANETALAKLSMINEPNAIILAIFKKHRFMINKELIAIDEDSIGEPVYKVEVWKYDPGLFTSTDTVDVFSLSTELKGNDEPRFEIALEKLLEENL